MISYDHLPSDDELHESRNHKHDVQSYVLAPNPVPRMEQTFTV